MNEYQQIELSRITPNPKNPRTLYDGPAFDALVESIKARGVIEPVIVRPANGKPAKKGKPAADTYELVAGERRFRASQAAELNSIPAIVRDLDDIEAFDVMTIENLHREDLTEFEEARAFKDYIDHSKDEGAVAILASRTGIDRRYIQRRVSVLSLPDDILNLWQKGVLSYGHLEQLLRLPEDEVPAYFDKYLDPDGGNSWDHRPKPVRELREAIDNKAIALKTAKFNPKKDTCKTCVSNTSRQADMFGDDLGGPSARCNNPVCFREKQRQAISSAWPADYKVKTTGFRFSDEVSYNQRHYIGDWQTPGEKCFSCPSFVSLMKLDGKIDNKFTCIGEKACFDEVFNKKTPQEKGASRSANHGEESREKLYQELIPELASGLDNDDVRQLRLTLAAMLHTSNAGMRWFKTAIARSKKDDWYYTVQTAWPTIETMDAPALWTAIRKISEINIKAPPFGHEARHMIAAHLGMDLARDWRITEEYLTKKTKDEIIALGSSLAILTDELAIAYRKDVIKAKKWETCKKSQLIDAVLKSGIDLAGKVPAEILNIEVTGPADPPDSDETEE